MNNSTKFLTTLAVGGVLISSAAGFMVVNAQTASPASSPSSNADQNYGRKNRKNDRNSAVKIALENKDYEAWKTAIAATPNGVQILAKVDTESKFTSLSEAHKATKTARDAEEKVRTDLGINDLMKPKMGQMKGRGMMHYQNETQTVAPTNN